MKLLDSSVLVDIDRGGVADRVEKLDDEGQHAISIVSVTELHLGVEIQYQPETETHRDAIQALERMLSRFEIYDIDRPVATAAAKIFASLRERGEPLDDLHDVYIAATARTAQLPVLSSNVDHFERIDDVPVIDWATY